MKFNIFFFGVVSVLIIFTMIGGMDMHEKVHGLVCKYMGGTPLYNWSLIEGKAYTTCVNYTWQNFTTEEITMLHHANLQNEIVTYNIMDIKTFLAMLIILQTLMMFGIFNIAQNTKEEVLKREVQQLQKRHDTGYSK